jgi:Na+-translocating ferredoxin:NAD+ oxidoreductase RnfE subunit
MMVLSYVLIVIGIITTVVGGVRFLIAAFEEGIWWGLGVLFFGIMTPIFLIFRFREAWPSTRTSLIGFALMIAGSFLQAWAGAA